jgi:hypothetical protein
MNHILFAALWHNLFAVAAQQKYKNDVTICFIITLPFSIVKRVRGVSGG